MSARTTSHRNASIPGWVLLSLAFVFIAMFGALAVYFRFCRVEDFSSGEGTHDLKEDQPFAWPCYLGPERDAASKETGLLRSWPLGGPPLSWSADLGPGYSSMAIARGRLVTMFFEKGHEVVMCLNADSGKPIWRHSWPANYAGQDSSYSQGPRSTPTIDNDRVYAVGACGVFACLKLENGQELWQHDLDEEYDAKQLLWGVSFSPLICKEMVITNPGGKKGAVVAFDKFTGEEVWKSGNEKASYSSPIFIHAAGQDQIVCFNSIQLAGIAAKDGRRLWTVPWHTSYDLNITVPLWIDDHLFISTGYGTGCAKLKFVKKDNGEIGVETVYRNDDLCNHFTNSVCLNHCIYGFNRDAGDLVCMDYGTGDVKWKKSKFGRGQLLVVDGHLIIQTEGALNDGGNVKARLILLEPTSEEYRENSSFVFSHLSKCWAAPALANRKLYVRDNEKLFCYDLQDR
jgi:outer membrane protein assembly factor BamB